MTRPGRRWLLPDHWTPRYVLDRTVLGVRERRHPEDPWLTADAVAFLSNWVRAGDVCLEWGSGRSSWWLAARGVQVLTVEHDQAWAASVRERSVAPGTVTLVAVDAADEAAYVGAHPDVGEVDLALVDGIHRAGCALRAATLVRPGGLLVIDNIERYLPSDSRSPEARGTAPPDEEWLAVKAALAGWRRYWTSSGVTDTAVWFRPVA